MLAIASTGGAVPGARRCVSRPFRAEQSFAELQKAQASLLLERTAASQSRFAAALSHDLNSPLIARER
jgi:signal transduction histidine kinase